MVFGIYIRNGYQAQAGLVGPWLFLEVGLFTEAGTYRAPVKIDDFGSGCVKLSASIN